MDSGKDLLNVVKDSMEAEGKLGSMRAEMRAEIIKLFSGDNNSKKTKIPNFPDEVLLLNELIREYFNWVGYKCTSTVFIAESDLGNQSVDRSHLIQELGVKENERTKELPLLFCLLETFKEMKNA